MFTNLSLYFRKYLSKVLDGEIDPTTYVFNGDAILYSTKEIGKNTEIKVLK